jgi:hypothetical protein
VKRANVGDAAVAVVVADVVAAKAGTGHKTAKPW